MFAVNRNIKLILSKCRAFLYGSVIGKGTIISSNVQLSKDVEIGKYGYIGPNCNFRGNIKIGNFFLCADSVHVVGGDHRFDLIGIPVINQGRDKAVHNSKTFIGTDVWIGRNVTIMRGVSIGDGCIIGAGSIVTSDVETGVVIAGVPAKEIRKRFQDKNTLQKHLESITNEKS